jgi:hypothetical protein
MLTCVTCKAPDNSVMIQWTADTEHPVLASLAGQMWISGKVTHQGYTLQTNSLLQGPSSQHPAKTRPVSRDDQVTWYAA